MQAGPLVVLPCPLSRTAQHLLYTLFFQLIKEEQEYTLVSSVLCKGRHDHDEIPRRTHALYYDLAHVIEANIFDDVIETTQRHNSAIIMAAKKTSLLQGWVRFGAVLASRGKM